MIFSKKRQRALNPGKGLWFFLFFFCVFTAALTAQANPADPRPVCFVDATGKTVTLSQPVEKLVVLTSDALEIIRALGAEELVVGVYSEIIQDSEFWPGLRDKPKVGNWKEVNYERIVELNPDAVLCYGRRPGQDLEKRLRPFDIRVIRLDFFRLEHLSREVEALGRILERNKQAGKLAAWYQHHINRMDDLLKSSGESPRVYIEGDSNYHTAGPGSGGHYICNQAGGNNIASGLSIAYPRITPEWVVMQDPEVIIKIATRSTSGSSYAMVDSKGFDTIRESIMSRPVWHHISAVQSGRVYVIANEIWTGPRAIIGACYLAGWFYPDLSEQFNAAGLHRRYLEEFQKIAYKGVFASSL